MSNTETIKFGSVTILEVANKAGVSKAAAWAALNDRKTNISLREETRERIVKIATEMNYRPNFNARGLTSQKTYLISFLCREAYSIDAMEILMGIQDVLFDKDYSVIVYVHGDSPEAELVNLKHCVSRRSEGLIVIPALDRDGRNNHDKFVELKEQGTPVVQVYTRVAEGIPSVTPNSYEVGKFAVNYLVERGHRRIAHLTNNDYRDTSLPGYYGDLKERWLGYRDAMQEAGLDVEVFEISDQIHYKIGGEAVSEAVVHSAYCPTAVTCYCDTMAMGLVKGLLREGVRVPEDISVIGHDGTELTTPGLESKLATFVKPLRQMGREAGKTIFDAIEGRKTKDVTCLAKFSPGISVATLDKNGIVKRSQMEDYHM